VVCSLDQLRSIPKVTFLQEPSADGVFKSTDNGQTWNDFSSGLTHRRVDALVKMALDLSMLAHMRVEYLKA